MAIFVKYWRIVPREYWQLTVEEHRAMVDLMKEENREHRRQQARMRRG